MVKTKIWLANENCKKLSLNAFKAIELDRSGGVCFLGLYFVSAAHYLYMI